MTTPFEHAKKLCLTADQTAPENALALYYAAPVRHRCIVLDLITIPYETMNEMRAILDTCAPRFSEKFPGKVALYKDVTDRNRDRLTAMKPGRAHRHLFPWLAETDHARFAESVNEYFAAQVNLKVITADDEDSFVHAYKTDPAPYTNPRTTCFRKSLANSCMRYGFPRLPKHPAAAYASGDFSILYIETGGAIAARTVLHKASNTYAPLYGCTDAALDTLERHLESIGASEDHGEWYGAKMQAIPHYGNYVMPYLDYEYSAEDCGGYLVLDDRGLNCQQTNGLTGDPETEYYCEYYDEPCDEVYTVYRDAECSEPMEVCENARNRHFTYCEDVSEYVDSDCVVPVNYITGSGRYNCEDRARDYVETVDGGYWDPSDTLETRDGDCVAPNDDDYQTCTESGDLLHIDEMTPHNGGYVETYLLGDEYRIEDGRLVQYIEVNQEWIHPDDTITLNCGTIVAKQYRLALGDAELSQAA